MSIADGVPGDAETDGAGETMCTCASGRPNVTPEAEVRRGFLFGGGVAADEFELLASLLLCLLSAMSLSAAASSTSIAVDFRAYRK